MRCTWILLFLSTLLSAQQTLQKDAFDSLYQKTVEYREKIKEDSMLYYGKSATLLAQENNDFYNTAKINITLGNFYQPFPDKDSITYQYYFKAYKAYLLAQDSLKISKTLLRLAILEKNNRSYLLSKQSSIRALEFLDGREPDFLEGIYNNLGIIFNELGNLKQSIIYHTKALSIRSSSQNLNLKMQSCNNIATAYKSHRQYKKAAQFYLKGLSYPDKTLQAHPYEYARLLDNYTHLRFLQNDTAQVQLNYFKALKLRQSVQDYPGIIMSYLHLSEWENKRNQFVQSNQYAQIVKTRAELTHNYRDVLEALTLMRKNYEELGETSMALKVSKLYTNTLEYIQKKELKVEEKFADIRYESAQKEDENNVLRFKNQQQEIKNQNQKIYLYFTLGTLAIALLCGLLYFNTIKLKNKQKELEHEQKEREAEQEIEKLLHEQQAYAEQSKRKEQMRIAHDLHDSIAGKLSGIMLQVDNLSQRVQPDLQPKINTLADYLSDIIQETHDIVQDMNQDRIVNLSFQTILEQSIQNHLPVTIHRIIDIQKVNWEISSSIKVAIYYIVQQALRNIQEHAKASMVWITMTQDFHQLQIEIKDNGKGFTSPKCNIGIPGMKKRAESVGGHFSIQSLLNQGTVIYLNFPLS